MIEKITVRHNGKIKLLSAVSTKKGREKYGSFLVEGKRMVSEAVCYAKNSINFIAVSELFVNNNKELLNELECTGLKIVSVPDSIFNSIADTATPQGIAAAVSKPPAAEPDVEEAERVLILDGVSEPGNMGTIIRTAEAAGIEYIFIMRGCVDVYNPKTVRATMGSIFRMKFIYLNKYEQIDKLRQSGFKVIASSLRGGIDLRENRDKILKSCSRRAVVVGSEAFGVSDELLSRADLKVYIPMNGSVESLNAAVAAGILMYLI